MKSVMIDTDVFVLDLRYPRDARNETNQKFLEKIRRKKIKGATSIFNIFEVCGILSFNYSHQNLLDLYSDFTQHYQIQIFFPALDSSTLQLEYNIQKIFSQIQKKQSLGDAQMSYVIEKFSENISYVVSWNAAHFEGKISVPVKTPAEFLKPKQTT